MNPHTHDSLIDPARREIVTTWLTSERVNEGTYDAGTVRVALSTTHSKTSKRFESRLNREVVTDSGFVTRSFRIFAAPTADSGIVLASEPTPRFNAKRAAALHDFVLTNLDLLVAEHHRSPEVAAELAALLANARVAA